MTSQALNIRQRLKLELLKLLARQGPGTFAISVLNAVIVYLVLQDVVPRNMLWPWVSATIAFNGLRMIMVIVFWRMPDEASYRTWSLLYLMLIYCTGACWGSLALFPQFFEISWAQGFIVFVIAGMSAGGILSLYVMLPAAIPYFLVTILPMVYVLAAAGEPQFVAMALLSSLYLVLLIRTTYSFNAIVRKTVRLELQSTELFDFLLEARETHDETLRSYHTRSDS